MAAMPDAVQVEADRAVATATIDQPIDRAPTDTDALSPARRPTTPIDADLTDLPRSASLIPITIPLPPSARTIPPIPTAQDHDNDDAESVSSDRSESNLLDLDLNGITEEQSCQWIKSEGIAVDRHDAFRRGAFCLKSGAHDAAIYWLDRALDGVVVPLPKPDPEPPQAEPPGSPVGEEKSEADEEDPERDDDDDDDEENVDRDQDAAEREEDTVATDDAVLAGDAALLPNDAAQTDGSVQADDAVAAVDAAVADVEMADAAEREEDTVATEDAVLAGDAALLPNDAAQTDGSVQADDAVAAVDAAVADVEMADAGTVDAKPETTDEPVQDTTPGSPSTTPLDTKMEIEGLTPRDSPKSLAEDKAETDADQPQSPVVDGSVDESSSDDEEAIAPDAEAAKILVFRARANQLKSDHVAAIRDFGSSLRFGPLARQQVGAFVLRAKSYCTIGRTDLALRDYSIAQALDPEEISTYIGRSALYVSLRDHELALEDCMKVLNLDSRHIVANRRSGLIFAETRRLPQAIRAFNRALAVRADYECLTLRGRTYVQLGQFDHALSDYSMAVSIRPETSLAYGHRSVLYAHLKRLDLAVNDATSFIQLTTDDQCLSAYQNRGVWWAQLGEFDKAISDFTSVIEAQSDNAFAYMSRATAYAQVRQFDKSIADWNKVAEMHPTMVKAFYNLGKQHVNSQDYDKAVESFNKVIELVPTNPAGYSERAKAESLAGKYEASLESWSQALQYDQQNPAILAGRALMYLHLSNIESALADFSAAIALNPADPSNYERRAALHLKRMDVQAGKSDMIIAKKLRWTIQMERVQYDELVERAHSQRPSHMAVVRAAQAATNASLSKGQVNSDQRTPASIDLRIQPSPPLITVEASTSPEIEPEVTNVTNELAVAQLM